MEEIVREAGKFLPPTGCKVTTNNFQPIVGGAAAFFNKGNTAVREREMVATVQEAQEMLDTFKKAVGSWKENGITISL